MRRLRPVPGAPAGAGALEQPVVVGGEDHLRIEVEQGIVRWRRHHVLCEVEDLAHRIPIVTTELRFDVLGGQQRLTRGHEVAHGGSRPIVDPPIRDPGEEQFEKLAPVRHIVLGLLRQAGPDQGTHAPEWTASRSLGGIESASKATAGRYHCNARGGTPVVRR